MVKLIALLLWILGVAVFYLCLLAAAVWVVAKVWTWATAA